MIKHIPFDPNQLSDRIPLVAENPAAIVSEIIAVFVAAGGGEVSRASILGHVYASLYSTIHACPDYFAEDKVVDECLIFLENLKVISPTGFSSRYKLIRPIALSEGVTNFLES